MSLKTKVKVGHITSLSDARYCAGMGVDMLGFPVGPQGLDPSKYKEIIEWVSGPEFVLEAQPEVTDLQEITKNYPGHYVEISKHQLRWLEENFDFIVRIKLSEWEVLKPQLISKRNIRFVETEGTISEMKTLKEIGDHFPVLIRIASGNLDEIENLPVSGIALEGSAEEKPGLKDYSELSSILERLEVD